MRHKWMGLAVAASTIVCSAMAQPKPATFAVPPQFSVGSADSGCLQGCPFPGTSADLNHDGYDDLVTLDYTTGSIFVTLGSAKGFRAPVSYPAGPSPIALTLGDFNGDGNLDAVVVAGSVYLLLGTGDGTFQRPVALTLPEQMGYAAAGDFNGDGKLDLALTAEFSDEVYVALGNGDGTFGTAIATAAPGLPVAVLPGSFHNNGLQDLVLIVVFRYFGAGYLLTSNGDGTFQLGPGLFVPGSAVVVADMNSDGHQDLVMSSGTFSGVSSEVQVWLGDGQGNFTICTSVAVEEFPVSLAVADVNGDGVPDVVSANSGSTVSILLGKGNGTLEKSYSYKGNGSPWWVGIGTYFGSDRADLAVINGVPNRGSQPVVSLLRNDGAGHFPGGRNIDFPFTHVPFVLADMNQDSFLDLLVANPGSTAAPSSVMILPGDGQGSFGKPLNVPVSYVPLYPVVADFDGDGTPDFAVLANAHISVGLQQAPNVYNVVATASTANALLWAGDLNGDGLADLIVDTNNGFSVLLSTGPGTFAAPLPVNASSSWMAVADFNNDGIPDLVISTPIAVMLGNGDGTFAPLTFIKGSVDGPIATGDFNGDGNQDFAIVKNCCDLLVFLGDGKGGFQALPAQSFQSVPTQLIAADLNHDGFPDLISVLEGTVQIYIGNGTGRFTAEPVTYYPEDASTIYVQAGDINNDGKIDFVSFATAFSMFFNSTK